MNSGCGGIKRIGWLWDSDAGEFGSGLGALLERRQLAARLTELTFDLLIKLRANSTLQPAFSDHFGLRLRLRDFAFGDAANDSRAVFDRVDLSLQIGGDGSGRRVDALRSYVDLLGGVNGRCASAAKDNAAVVSGAVGSKVGVQIQAQ